MKSKGKTIKKILMTMLVSTFVSIMQPINLFADTPPSSDIEYNQDYIEQSTPSVIIIDNTKHLTYKCYKTDVGNGDYIGYAVVELGTFEYETRFFPTGDIDLSMQNEIVVTDNPDVDSNGKYILTQVDMRYLEQPYNVDYVIASLVLPDTVHKLISSDTFCRVTIGTLSLGKRFTTFPFTSELNTTAEGGLIGTYGQPYRIVDLSRTQIEKIDNFQFYQAEFEQIILPECCTDLGVMAFAMANNINFDDGNTESIINLDHVERIGAGCFYSSSLFYGKNVTIANNIQLGYQDATIDSGLKLFIDGGSTGKTWYIKDLTGHVFAKNVWLNTFTYNQSATFDLNNIQGTEISNTIFNGTMFTDACKQGFNEYGTFMFAVSNPSMWSHPRSSLDLRNSNFEMPSDYFDNTFEGQFIDPLLCTTASSPEETDTAAEADAAALFSTWATEVKLPDVTLPKVRHIRLFTYTDKLNIGNIADGDVKADYDIRSDKITDLSQVFRSDNVSRTNVASVNIECSLLGTEPDKIAFCEYNIYDLDEREAFKGWSNLETVTINAPSLERFTDAFDSCDKLVSVDLSNTNLRYTERLFYNCPMLTHVDWSDSLTFALNEEDYTFMASHGLFSYDSGTYYKGDSRYNGEETFIKCPKLDGECIPQNAKLIPLRFIEDCFSESKPNIAIPDSVIYMSSGGFREVDLGVLTMPKYLQFMELGAIGSEFGDSNILVAKYGDSLSRIDTIDFSKCDNNITFESRASQQGYIEEVIIKNDFHMPLNTKQLASHIARWDTEEFFIKEYTGEDGKLTARALPAGYHTDKIFTSVDTLECPFLKKCVLPTLYVLNDMTELNSYIMYDCVFDNVLTYGEKGSTNISLNDFITLDLSGHYGCVEPYANAKKNAEGILQIGTIELPKNAAVITGTTLSAKSMSTIDRLVLPEELKFVGKAALDFPKGVSSTNLEDISVSIEYIGPNGIRNINTDSTNSSTLELPNLKCISQYAIVNANYSDIKLGQQARRGVAIMKAEGNTSSLGEAKDGYYEFLKMGINDYRYLYYDYNNYVIENAYIDMYGNSQEVGYDTYGVVGLLSPRRGVETTDWKNLIPKLHYYHEYMYPNGDRGNSCIVLQKEYTSYIYNSTGVDSSERYRETIEDYTGLGPKGTTINTYDNYLECPLDTIVYGTEEADGFSDVGFVTHTIVSDINKDTLEIPGTINGKPIKSLLAKENSYGDVYNWASTVYPLYNNYEGEPNFEKITAYRPWLKHIKFAEDAVYDVDISEMKPLYNYAEDIDFGGVTRITKGENRTNPGNIRYIYADAPEDYVLERDGVGQTIDSSSYLDARFPGWRDAGNYTLSTVSLTGCSVTEDAYDSIVCETEYTDAEGYLYKAALWRRTANEGATVVLQEVHYLGLEEDYIYAEVLCGETGLETETNVGYNASGLRMRIPNYQYYVAGPESITASNLEYLGDYGFMYFTKLADITLGKLKHIGKHAFDHVTLEEIDTSKVEFIGEMAFNCCGDLQYFLLPSCLNTIEDHALDNMRKEDGTSALSKLIIEDNANNISVDNNVMGTNVYENLEEVWALDADMNIGGSFTNDDTIVYGYIGSPAETNAN